MNEFRPVIRLRIESTSRIQSDAVPPPADFPWERTTEASPPLLAGVIAHHMRLTNHMVRRGSSAAETNAGLAEAVQTAALAVGAVDGFALSDEPPLSWRVRDDGSWDREGLAGIALRIVSRTNGAQRFAMRGADCEYWLCALDPDA